MCLVIIGSSGIEPDEQVQYGGRSITITCDDYVLQWQFNGFSPSPDVIVDSRELLIKNVQQKHAGKYRCLTMKGWGTSILHVGGGLKSTLSGWNVHFIKSLSFLTPVK